MVTPAFRPALRSATRGWAPASLVRFASTQTAPALKAALERQVPAKRELAKELKAVGDAKIGDLTAGHALGGMRSLKALVWEGSVLDPDEGIRFHGRTIADCQRELPKGPTGTQMLPEAMFWLLLTGEVPSTEAVRAFSAELAARSTLPPHIISLFKSFPADMHPMTQLSVAVAALNTESSFARAYAEGINKTELWKPAFDDSIDLLAKIPRVAALVFRPKEIDAVAAAPLDPSLDWAANFAVLLGRGGKDDTDFVDLLRLYLALHGDHEGGNVSAHATHLVGSALSDPYLSYSAGLLGLAGPLHGLAAQEVLRWVLAMKDKIGTNFGDEDVRDYLWSTLKGGQVVPGYGHGVLRKPDPRFAALMEFAASRPDIQADPVFRLVQKNSVIAPVVLTEHGKTKNPHPNVDAASGVLFYHYGFQQPLYYTVTFGVSRALGPLAQLIWSRALGLPIERPKSIDMKGLLSLAKK